MRQELGVAKSKSEGLAQQLKELKEIFQLDREEASKRYFNVFRVETCFAQRLGIFNSQIEMTIPRGKLSTFHIGLASESFIVQEVRRYVVIKCSAEHSIEGMIC